MGYYSKYKKKTKKEKELDNIIPNMMIGAAMLPLKLTGAVAKEALGLNKKKRKKKK